MSKRALLISVVTAMAVITAGCDEDVTPTDGGMTTQDGGMTGGDDGGMTGEEDGGMTGEEDGGMTGEEDGGTGEEDGGTGEEDGGTGEEDGGTGEEDGGTGDVCGDGMVTGDETCDSAIEAGMPGACPADCDDGLACTTDTLVGDATTCDAECTVADITSCTAGDGCCPSACTMAEDADCACTPRTTCMADECGMVDDGCGNPLDCGACGAGGACATDADCDGNVCLTEAANGWTDGYCSIGCIVDADCGAGAHCATYGTTDLCLSSCTSNADCRTGYSCQDVDGAGSMECAPSATGTGAPGAACTSYADCAGGDDGFCILEGEGWQQGYCSLSCATDSDCGTTGHCGLIDDTTGEGICLADCTADTDCRAAGYGCYDLDGDTTSECSPSATGTGAVGAACAASGDCAGGHDGFCALGWQGGYCTANCTADADCGTGGHCVAGGDGGICLTTCTSDAGCRTGYGCYDFDSDSTSECIEAGTGTGAVGAACTGHEDCSGGPAGYCDPSLPGGYCMQFCASDGSCSAGSTCVILGDSNVCLDDCTGSGMGDCRSGYTCTPLSGGGGVCYL